jgi:WS/DGAT/MGAT family acyltransferase
MAASSVPMANVDSAWLRMDDPTNLMVVTGLLVLDRPVSLARIRSLVEERLLRFPRFRQRVVGADVPLGTPTWSDDERFDLAYHVQAVDLPPPGDEAALQALVSALMSRPLSAERPLWQFHLVPHYQGGSALIGRIHHCIGDGLALIYVMLALSDGGPQPPAPAEADGAEADGGWEVAVRTIAAAAGQAAALPVAVLRQLAGVVSSPERVLQATGQAAAGLGALAKLLLMDPDPPTVLKGPLVAVKRAVWSRPLPLAEVKRIGRVTGATINDVLVAAVSGALGRYLAARGQAPAPDLSIRAVVPVNLRPIEEAHLLGNQFGLVFLSLPVGLDDPLERVFEVRRRMTAIKRSPEAYVAFQILRAIGMAPRQIFDLVVELFGRKATAVMTNVVGPRERLAMAGVPLRQAMFWVPCAGRLGLGISVLSYAGEVWIGLHADAHVIPDPQVILEGFDAEIRALAELVPESWPAGEPPSSPRAAPQPGPGIEPPAAAGLTTPGDTPGDSPAPHLDLPATEEPEAAGPAAGAGSERRGGVRPAAQAGGAPAGSTAEHPET